MLSLKVTIVAYKFQRINELLHYNLAGMKNHILLHSQSLCVTLKLNQYLR